MAILADADRQEVRAKYCNELPGENVGPLPAIVKDDFLAAVAGLDEYLDANATAINQAIPQPARGALSVKQKALLLVYVIRQRYMRA